MRQAGAPAPGLAAEAALAGDPAYVREARGGVMREMVDDALQLALDLG